MGVYFGKPCYGYALNCLHTTPVILENAKVIYFIYMQPQNNEIHICSNKHEIGLVEILYVDQMLWPTVIYCCEEYFAKDKNAIIFLPISLNICFGCSKGVSPWDDSFEYPQHMFWLRNKRIGEEHLNII